MAWFCRVLNSAIALRTIEVTRVSSAVSITRFCSPLELNGSLNLERRSTYLIFYG
jgi:hypothetical protein